MTALATASNPTYAGEEAEDKFATYWQAYNLQRDPFISTSQDSLFQISQWTEYGDLLQHLCLYGNVLIAVTGGIDNGKSTFLHCLESKLKENIDTYSFDADPKLDPEELLEIISDAFSLPDAIGDDLESRYHNQLTKINRSDRSCVILIDDAHQLPHHILEILFNVTRKQSDEKPQIHFVLIGDPELQEKLENVQPKQIIDKFSHILSLRPLNLDETEQYLRYCFKKVCTGSDFPFSIANIFRIHKLSEGYIGRINRVAKQLLIDALYHQNNKSSLSFLEDNRIKLLGGSIIAIAILIAAFTLSGHNNNKDTTLSRSASLPVESKNIKEYIQANHSLPTQRSVTAATRSQPSFTPTESDLHAQQQNDDNITAVVKEVTTIDSNSTPVSHISSAPKPRNLPSENKQARLQVKPVQQRPAAKTPTVTAPTKIVVTQPTKATIKPVTVAAAPPSVIKVKKAQKNLVQASISPAISDEDLLKPMPFENNQIVEHPIRAALIDRVIAVPEVQKHKVATVKPAPKQQVVKHATQSTVKPQLSKPKKSVRHHAAATKPVKSATPALVENKAKNKTKDYFVLQLIANGNESAMRKYIAKHHLKQNAKYYRSKRHGKDWFVLIYGQYASYAAASKAAKQLPTVIRQNTPWIRPHSLVVKELSQKG